jgi:hypothetical protein
MKISTFETVLLVVFVIWASVLDLDHLTGVEEVGVWAVFIYGILMVVKIVKR